MDFLYLLAVLTTNVLAQNSAATNVVEAIPPWLKLAGAIVALITAIIGVPARILAEQESATRNN
jgi:hypothetical protein